MSRRLARCISNVIIQTASVCDRIEVKMLSVEYEPEGGIQQNDHKGGGVPCDLPDERGPWQTVRASCYLFHFRRRFCPLLSGLFFRFRLTASLPALLRCRAAFTGFSDLVELLIGEMLDSYE